MRKIMILFIGVIFFSGSVFANPVGGVVTAGNAVIIQSNGNTVVQQNSPKAILNWQSFNIGAKEKTHFQQPQGGVALNRINANQGPSQIYGQLTATGKIILVNQAGIFFGPSAYVNVGGIIASTSNISDQNFLAGKFIFDVPSSNGSIVNKGTIIAAQNGLVALLGNSVTNEGLIQAEMGSVILASGSKFTIDLYGDQLINFTVDAPANAPADAINNSGTIIADGGTVLMTAKTASEVVDNVINMSGVVQAKSVDNKNGEIILSSDSPGMVLVSGLLDASGVTANQTGGIVKVLGDEVAIASNAKINVSGAPGGGEIVVGGNNALTTYVGANAMLDADALNEGNGGQVTVWANDDTYFYGKISARGGVLGGDGGYAETSGDYLDVTGGQVDLSAAKGSFGTWLLDPTNIYIAANQADATAAGMSGTDTSANTGPTPFAASGAIQDSLLTTSALTTALATSNVVVTTTNAAGTGTGQIIVVDPITWTAASSLNLTAASTITINAGITAVNGQLILNAGSAGSPAAITTNAAGAINVGTFSLAIGAWSQTSSLPSFTATNFIIDNGSLPSSNASFLRSAGGNGTVGSPYQLTDIYGIQGITSSAALLGDAYILNNDVDASVTQTWNSNAGFIPIGDYLTTRFTGNFNGAGHTINNLNINVTSLISKDIGLFGTVGGPGSISNVGVTNANIFVSVVQLGGTVNMGILAGQLLPFTSISNSYTSGTITNTSGSVRIGGLVGISTGNIEDSYSTASVNVTYSGLGGFANVGGLLGFNFTIGNVINSYDHSGIISVNLTGGATDSIQVGGLVGANETFIDNNYSLDNIVLSGNSDANLLAGGFVGWNLSGNGNITDSYSAGAVTGSGAQIGGFAGVNDGFSYIINSFWDTDTSGLSLGISSSNGIENQVTGGCFSGTCTNGGTVNLSAANTFNTTWDFSSVWGIVEGKSYPYLLDFYPTTPRAISGNSSTTENNNVILSSGGATLDTTNTFTNGAYYFLESNGAIADNTPVLLYLSGAATKSNVVTVMPASDGSVVNATFAANTLQIGDGNTNTISNSILATALGSLSSSDILYSVSSGNIVLGTASNLTAILTSSPSTTYNMDTNVLTINGGNSSDNLLGITNINAGSIATTGSQNYNGVVNLGTDVSLSSAAAGITFSGTVNGAHALSIANGSGAVTFGAQVGNVTPLSSLIIGTGDTTTANGSITTSGAQTYNSAFILNANTTLTGSSTITLGDITGNGNNLTLLGSAGSDNFIFNGNVNGVNSFSLDGGDTTNVNTMTFANNITINLSSIDTGSINFSNVVGTFSRIQQAVASGVTGSLVLPSGNNYSVIYYNSPTNTNGQINDPFYFSNFTLGNVPPPPPPSPAPSNNTASSANIANVMVSVTPSSPNSLQSQNQANSDSSDQDSSNIDAVITDTIGLTAITEDITLTDAEDSSQRIFACFK